MFNSETTEYIRGIRVTDEDYEWIKKNKKKKSAAGFLREIIRQYKNGKNKT